SNAANDDISKAARPSQSFRVVLIRASPCDARMLAASPAGILDSSHLAQVGRCAKLSQAYIHANRRRNILPHEYGWHVVAFGVAASMGGQRAPIPHGGREMPRANPPPAPPRQESGQR